MVSMIVLVLDTVVLAGHSLYVALVDLMSNFKFRFSLTKVSKSNIFTQKLSFQTK